MNTMKKIIKKYRLLLGNTPLCNKRKERAPHIGDLYFILCWRCTGLIIGAILFIFLLRNNMQLSYSYRLIFISPLLLDALLSYYTDFYSSNNFNRVTTGFLGGIALSF